MSRDPSSVSSQLFDLVCVAVLGLLLALFAGVVARATPTAALVKAAADCDKPAAPDVPATAAGPAMRGGLPASMSIAAGGCAGEEGKTPGAAPAPSSGSEPAQPSHP